MKRQLTIRELSALVDLATDGLVTIDHDLNGFLGDFGQLVRRGLARSAGTTASGAKYRITEAGRRAIRLACKAAGVPG